MRDKSLYVIKNVQIEVVLVRILVLTLNAKILSIQKEVGAYYALQQTVKHATRITKRKTALIVYLGICSTNKEIVL